MSLPSEYAFIIEGLEETYSEFEPLYRRHHAEMNARLEADGVKTYPYNPDLPGYFMNARAGTLIHYSVRHEGKAVGHANVYVFKGMHDQVLMAQEDVLYIVPEHRNGIGKKLVRFILDDLQSRGVRKVMVQAVTDLRVEKIWRRMGFKTLASMMQYEFTN